MNKIYALTSALVVLVVALSGCASGAYRAKGGNASHVAADGAKVNFQQPENPKDGAKQGLEVSDTTELPVAAGSTLEIGAGTNRTTVTLASNAVVKVSHTEKSHSEVGAAQKDTVGETIAKMKASHWLGVIGALLVIVGVAFIAYPPLRALTGGSIGPGAAIVVTGLGFIALPYILVGHETFIIVAACLVAGFGVALWWFHNHGGIVAELATLKATLSPQKTATAAPASTARVPNSPASSAVAPSPINL